MNSPSPPKAQPSPDGNVPIPTASETEKPAPARKTSKVLTDAEVKSAKPDKRQYKLADYGSLYLLVKPKGSKLWQWPYSYAGKAKTYSIGPYPAVGILAARTARNTARDLVKKGIDPTQHRAEERRQAEAKAVAHTLGEAWRVFNEKTKGSLATRTVARREREVAANIPKNLMQRPVGSVTRKELVTLIDAVEARAPTVARNVRQHLNGIFELAINRGDLSSNPVPPASTLASHRSVPNRALMGDRLGDFLHVVHETSRVELKTKVAMALLLYSVLRKNEASGARWSEFNLDRGDWHVPASRMKERIEHWIPLSQQTIDLMREWKKYVPEDSDVVFPNRRDPQRPMAGNTLNGLMDKSGFGGEGTPHGLRSAFSTLFNERKRHYADVIEKCLSHQAGNAIRSVYNRYEYADERRELLQEWADYLDTLRRDAAVRASTRDQRGQ